MSAKSTKELAFDAKNQIDDILAQAKTEEEIKEIIKVLIDYLNYLK